MLTVKISGWLYEYWLAPTDELMRLVPDEPERRSQDVDRIRWDVVAEAACAAVRAGRDRLGEDVSPALSHTWDVSVVIATPTELTNEEARIVSTLFSWESAISDFGSQQVTNGRHRMYHAWRAASPLLPIRSSAVSAWTGSLFGDPSCTELRFQVWDCAALHRFAGECAVRRAEPGADLEFIEAIADAVEVADRFLTEVAADAYRFKPDDRRLVPE